MNLWRIISLLDQQRRGFVTPDFFLQTREKDRACNRRLSCDYASIRKSLDLIDRLGL